MKFLRTISVITMAFSILSFKGVENIPNGSYPVNISKSQVNWTGEKVTGEHSGTIGVKSGVFQLQEGDLKGGSFVIDMGSISVNDLDGEYRKKLEGHLKSDDFFGVKKFPIARFNITNVAPGGDEGKYRIAGAMTIKNITKQIEFDALLENKGGSLNATASIIIDRADFDVRYGSGSFFENMGDKMIYDDFILKVNLIAQ
jgi:polyisoprenoid-binding protein YceI